MNRSIRIRLLLCAGMFPLLFPSLYRTPLFCQPTGTLSIWPEHRLPVNGRIVLSGTPERIEPILASAPSLISGSDTVPLHPTTRYVLSEEFHQVVLAPERLLLPSRDYQLDGETESVQDRYHVRTDPDEDTLSPVWNGPPAYIGGCHRDEEHYLYLALPVGGTGSTAIETELIDSLGNRQTFLAFPRPDIVEQFSGALLASETVPLKLDPPVEPGLIGNMISVPDHILLPIGHGRYGGEIIFPAGANYRIRFTAIDAAGNRSTASPEGIITLPSEHPDLQRRTGVAGEKIEEISPSGTNLSSPSGVDGGSRGRQIPLIPRFTPTTEEKP